MAKESLVERVAKKNAEYIACNTDNVDQLVMDIRVSGRTVEYQDKDGEWMVLSNLKELATRSVDDILDSMGLIVSGTSYENLQELSAVCSSCWNSKLEMFEIDYKTDSDGDLESLVVPIGSSISDDFILQEIHDENGEFVAHNVEEQIDVEVYELWNIDMYVKSISDDADVFIEYRSSFVDLFSEYVDERTDDLDEIEEDFVVFENIDSASEWLTNIVAQSIILGIIVVAAIVAYSIFGIMGLTIVCLLTFFGFIPTFYLHLYVGILASVYAISEDNFGVEKFFETS